MKYIGNKSNLLGFIEESLKSAGVQLQGTFTDLFSGTTSVAEHFKKLGFSVTANDSILKWLVSRFRVVKVLLLLPTSKKM